MALKYEDIKKEFQNAVDNDKEAKKLYAQIRNGDASYATSGKLAQRIGANLGKVLMKHAPINSIDEWDVDDLIPKALGLDHRMVVTACKQVQENMNKDAKVGIKYKEPKFNMDKAQGIVKELKDNPEFTNIEKTFYDQLENFSRSVADDSIVANAGVMWKAGIKTIVVRTAEADCCKWCSEMAGTYNYADVKEPGNDVWRRHENCNCTIDFYTERNGEVQRERVKEGRNDETERRIEIHSSSSDKRDLSYLSEGKGGLTKHEKSILNRIPSIGSFHEFKSGYVTENDMVRLSAYTNHEMALWRSKNKDILCHGDGKSCNPAKEIENELKKSYEWIAHTHVDRGPLVPSMEDRSTLRLLNQHSSVLLGVDGTRTVFTENEFDDL